MNFKNDILKDSDIAGDTAGDGEAARTRKELFGIL